MVTNKKPNQRERYRLLVQSAMPEVKRLVKKYGRAAIGNCLGKIAAFEKESKRLQKMKKEVADLENRLH